MEGIRGSNPLSSTNFSSSEPVSKPARTARQIMSSTSATRPDQYPSPAGSPASRANRTFSPSEAWKIEMDLDSEMVKSLYIARFDPRFRGCGGCHSSSGGDLPGSAPRCCWARYRGLQRAVDDKSSPILRRRKRATDDRGAAPQGHLPRQTPSTRRNASDQRVWWLASLDRRQRRQCRGPVSTAPEFRIHFRVLRPHAGRRRFPRPVAWSHRTPAASRRGAAMRFTVAALLTDPT